MKPSTKSRSYLACIALGALFLFVTSASAAAKEKKEWAILTYLNGFNSLDSFGYSDMNEMEKVGSSARVHVVSEWASLQTKQVKRIYVEKDSDPNQVTSPVVENLGQVDMGDYRTLVDFVKWAVENYPADHYFINVWNHGNGWHFSGNGPIHSTDLSYDDLSGNHITTEQLGVAMAEISKDLGKKVDLFGSDSCLMAMAEVVGQMKDSVGQFVGSQEVEPADGWPYDTLLTRWNDGGPKSAADVGEILSKAYVDSYTNGQDATLSSMDLGRYSDLANSVRDLADSIKTLPPSSLKKVLQAVENTQAYELDDYKDLGDLVDRLSADSSIGIRPDVLASVKSAVGRFVTSNHDTSGMARSHGVSIWFPDSSWEFDSYKDRYRALSFNQDTGWFDAISATLGSAGLL